MVYAAFVDSTKDLMAPTIEYATLTQHVLYRVGDQIIKFIDEHRTRNRAVILTCPLQYAYQLNTKYEVNQRTHLQLFGSQSQSGPDPCCARTTTNRRTLELLSGRGCDRPPHGHGMHKSNDRSANTARSQRFVYMTRTIPRPRFWRACIRCVSDQNFKSDSPTVTCK